MSRMVRSKRTNAAGINAQTNEEVQKGNIARVQPKKYRTMTVEEVNLARKIWLRFVGNSQHWGRHSTQEIQVVFDARLKCYMDRYASGVGQSRQYLRFFGPEGDRLDGEKTAENYGLEDGDQIDVFEWQVGGNNE